jgi:CRISPR-associated protein Csb2
MRKAKRVVPRVTAWVDYRFPPHFGFAPEHSTAFVRPVVMPARVERFMLEATSASLLPSVTETITVAEAFRGATMKRFSTLFGSAASAMLSGKSEDGTKGLGHRHAYYLPRDLNNDGKIDHIDVYFPTGSTHDEHRAVTAVDRIYDWRFDLAADQHFVTTYLGEAEPAIGSTWQTETPCILDRQPKRRDLADGNAFFTAQIREMLLRHGITEEPMSIAVWPARETLQHRGGNRTLLSSFRAARSSAPRLPAFGLTVEFDAPIKRPIVFGRLAHFGLGQLRPAR